MKLGLALIPLIPLLASCCLQVMDGQSTSGASGSNGGSGGECFTEVPTNHRPSSVACVVSSEGRCTQDSDCTPPDGGRVVCSCAPHGAQGANGTGINACILSGCHVDADCGCGYCSPTEGTRCVYETGFVGYYCHTRADTCINDSGCDGGLCEYSPLLDHWACATGFFCNG